MVSLADIAKEVNLNVSVVSRALNPNPDRHAVVKEETRRLIRETAARMNYCPNRQASFIGKKSCATIFCFMPNTADRLTADLMFGITEAAGRENFPVNFFYGGQHEDFHNFIDNMERRLHSGLLTYPAFALSENIRNWLRSYHEKRNTIILLNAPSNLPLAGLESEYRDITQVYIDDFYGGQLAARHLLERGCKKFYFTYLKPSPYHARRNGFASIIENAGFEIKILDGEEDYRALEKTRVKTGIYADRDVHALNVLIMLARHGIIPGERILLVGNDDKQQSRFAIPTLTTVHQPMRQEGAFAVKKLINMIFNGKEETEVLKPYLIVRESTGGKYHDPYDPSEEEIIY